MHSVRVNDINLAHYVVGEGGPVLMLQDLGGRAADWASLPARPAHRFEGVTFE